MDSPLWYKCSNHVQRHDAKVILDEYSKILKWNDNYDDEVSLLDIGCGCGDVTIDFILPLLPKNFKKLIGADISENMVQYAKETYKNDKIDFEILDISVDQINEKFRGRFNYVTSLYCLHWVHDQQKAIKNIYEALKDNGDCLLLFLKSHPIFDVYEKLSTVPKWSTYMTDVDKFIPILQYHDNAKLDLTKYFQNSGFTEYFIEIKELLFKYEGTENFKRNFKAVNPFVKRLTSNQQDEYMNDLVKCIEDMNIPGLHKDKFDNIHIKYKLVVAHARKMKLH